MKTVTLHEEMLAILRYAGVAMRSADIAAAVNKRSKYHRHDGESLLSSQIRARAHNYQNLFILNGPFIDVRHG